MRLEFLERHSLDDGPLHRLDARVKLLGAAAFIAASVATPLGAWRALGAQALALALLVGLSGVPPRGLLRRGLAFAPLVVSLGLMVGLTHPSRASLGLWGVAASIAAKNALAILAILVLANVTPFPRLLDGLRRLGVPAVLVGTLHFMYRYLHVLADVLDRMLLARRARTFRRSGRLDWGLLTGLLGVLFLRSMERGERVHAAMLARGWDGTWRPLDGPGA
jgi:cobalt/nickel transport system permease protein